MLDREGAAGPADVALFGNVEQQTRTRQLLLSMR
jgi:hypothetical protein